MLLLRRLPGLVYTHKYTCLALLLSALGLTLLLHSWGFICTNWEPWKRVETLCAEYERGLVTGDMCHSLCVEKSIRGFSCRAFHAGKETVFSALLNGQTPLVIKSAREAEPGDVVHWVDDDGEHFPTEEAFLQMIQARVKSRLNFTISEEVGKRLSRFPSGHKSILGSSLRNAEMKEIWSLLQDNEYLLSMVYSEKDIFPHVLGTCGQLFGVEFLKPALDGEMAKILSEDSRGSSWGARIHLAVMIIDLLEQIDSEGLLLCDIKPSHFGISATGKLKILDLDVAFPKQVADTMTGDERPCTLHSDCHLFDCHSKCNLETHTCDSPVINTNLQIVCEKIFLGWAMSGKLMVPGLLMSQETKPSLASLLRQCAEPESPEVIEHISQRLIDTLSELDAAYINREVL